jgi:hypothetical protein
MQRRFALSDDDRRDRRGSFQDSPTGPWGAPPRASASPPPAEPRVAITTRQPIWSGLFAIVFLGLCVRACGDISRPEAWTYWRESFFSPSMTSSVIANTDPDGGGRVRRALAIHGTIGVASAGWLREQINVTNLAAGDLVLLSSPGGDLDQALIMGEIVRSHRLATAVGTADGSGRIAPSFCASACVLVFAGGMPRYGVEGSILGVHRFTNAVPGGDPVADAQRISGMILGYVTKMGVSSTILEAMSATTNVRWLEPAEAVRMKLVTDPIGQAEAARR